jgi:hypothetical protein
LGPVVHQQEWEFSNGLRTVLLKFEIIVSKDTFRFFVVDFDGGLRIINLSDGDRSLVFESTILSFAALAIGRID